MKQSLILISILVLVSCKDTIIPVRDQTYTLRGSVIDTSLGKSVPGVYFGFRDSSLPDSSFFEADSLKAPPPAGFMQFAVTDSTGRFEMDWFLGMRDTSLYRFLVAYKSGYQLWRNDLDPRQIVPISEGVDTLQVVLSHRFGLDIPGTHSSVYLKDSTGAVKSVFQSQERITLVYTFTNSTGADLNWTTAMANPWVRFYVLQGDSVIGDSFAGKAFAAWVVYGVLPNGESHVVQWSFPGSYPYTDFVVPPGQYVVKAVVYFGIYSTTMVFAPDIETTFVVQP